MPPAVRDTVRSGATPSAPIAPLAAALRSGWTPAALVTSVIAALLLTSGLSARDVVTFCLYAVLGLTVPGTLLWRLVRPRRPRPWLEDVVFGTILGYCVEIATFLVARGVGVPLLVLAWPLGMLVFATATRRGRGLWRHEETERTSAGCAWSVAAITTYLVLFVARANWWGSGADVEGLRVISPDASFQLALTGEVRHHLPPQVPWLLGERLYYHWFTYVHVAATSWVTGIEPIDLLRRLSPALMMVLIVLATALIARTLSGSWRVGALGAGLLVLVHSPAFDAAETDHFQRQEFTSQAIFGSPTQTFGTLLFCGVLFLSLELLTDRPIRSSWLLLVPLTVVTSGAKGTFAPMLVAAAVGVVLVAWLARSLTRTHWLLLALFVANWAAFQLLFYGGSAATGVRLGPAGTLAFVTGSIGIPSPTFLSPTGLAIAVVLVLLWGVRTAGMVGLLVRGGWRNPASAFLVVFVVSGVGASLFLDMTAFSQQWFVCSAQVPAAVGAACGFHRLVPVGALRDALPLAVTAALLGACGMAVGWGFEAAAATPAESGLLELWDYAAPFLLTVALLVLLAIVFSRLPSPLSPAVVATLVLASGLAGLGLFRTTQLAASLATQPWDRPASPSPAETTVGEGGIAAARWLRENSGPGDVLATNGHMLSPGSDLPMAFWLAGYAERRVLVEGWGYTPPHNKEVLETGVGFDEVPFWDRQLLQANDVVFTHPGRSNVDRLHDSYGVDWLVVDTRFPSAPDELSKLVPPSFELGDYQIHRLQ